MKFKINLIDVGRDKVNKEFIDEFDSEQTAGLFAYENVKRYLLSSEVSLEPDENAPTEWKVYAGLRNVGKVTIKEVKEELK